MSTWKELANDMPDWVNMEEQAANLAAAILILMDNLLAALPESPERTRLYNVRKVFFKDRKFSSNFRKLIPNEEGAWQILSERLQEWEDLQMARQSALDQFEQAIQTGFQRIQILTDDPVLRSGWLFSSHEWLLRAEEFSTQKADFPDKKDRRAGLSIVQYLSRAIFKTSPFSSFTTLSVQSFESTGRDRVGEWFESRSSVVPNVALLPFIYDALWLEPDFRAGQSLRLNPSVRKMTQGGYEWLYFDGETEAFQQLAGQPLLDHIWNEWKTKEENTSFRNLAGMVMEATSAGLNEAQSWIEKLIQMGFLEWIWPEKGLSPGWCGGLYQYLGYQPGSERTTAAAYLLQWLRTTARTMPFQEPEAVVENQRSAGYQVKSFLEQSGIAPPLIPTEQLFYEDIYRDTPLTIPADVLKQTLDDLHACWQMKSEHVLPTYRASLVSFAQRMLEPGASMNFLDFCKRYLEAPGRDGAGIKERVCMHRFDGKVGAVVQFYQENGRYKAVLNGLYPGGGKMFARWMGQLPPADAEVVKSWMEEDPQHLAPFPFPGWSNVHFQPILSNGRIQTPDARIPDTNAAWKISLNELEVRLLPDGRPVLWDPDRMVEIGINDLGLEAPDQLPPVRRILWNLGVPYVSLDAMLPEGFGWEILDSIRHRKRSVYQSLILAREAWLLNEVQWRSLSPKGQTDAEQVRNWAIALDRWKVPGYFFGRFLHTREKPQLYDLKSPLSMLLLLRNIHKGKGDFLITEMLPLPSQCPAERVQEYVLEWDSRRYALE